MNRNSLEKAAVCSLSEVQWNELSLSVARAFRLTAEETTSFQSKKIAKLIGAIPFLAGCENPERTAVGHLGTYILSVKMKDVANCTSNDDENLLKRLEPLGNFIGGDPAIIKRGMNLLALNMISDYKRDMADDIIAQKYNPMVSGAWDYDKLAEQLRADLEAAPCGKMDEILTVEDSTKLWWEFG